MLWAVGLLDIPVAAELELFCRFLKVFIRDKDEFLLSYDFLDPEGVPCALAREASP